MLHITRGVFSVLRERESREHHINRKRDGEKEKLQKCIIVIKNKFPPSALSPSSLFFNPLSSVLE